MPPDAPWTFTSVHGTVVTVVDAFLEGDMFTLYDNGIPIGSTTLVANTGTDSGTSDPAVALTIFALSRGFFSLPAGSNSLTIQVVQNSVGQTSGGAAFFRVDIVPCPVPIPGALLLFGPGLVGLAAMRKRFKK
jgi:hypothetical protein